MENKEDSQILTSIVYGSIRLNDILSERESGNNSPFFEFRKNNEVGLRLFKTVEKVKLHLGVPSLIFAINFCSFSCKKPQKITKNNSILMISGKGCGKSLLLSFLRKSNNKAYSFVPSRNFESMMLDNPKSFYERKVLQINDLIVTFSGLDKKQLEQLLGLYIELLADGSYSRQMPGGNIKKIEADTQLFCGLAEEGLTRHVSQLLSSTFFDRVIPFKYSLSDKDKLEILKYESKKTIDDVQNTILPKFQLPYYKARKKIEFNPSEAMHATINHLAMELDLYQVVSFMRASHFISLFMMGNALLNNRTKVNIHDLHMYELLHKYFKNAIGQVELERVVYEIFLNNEGKKLSEIRKLSKIATATFYRHYDNLVKKGKLPEMRQGRK